MVLGPGTAPATELNTSLDISALDEAGRAAVRAMVAAAGCDLVAGDSFACRQVLSELRVARGWMAATEARASSRLAALAATESAPPVTDAHVRDGGVSAAEARRKQRRATTLDQAEGFGDALATGRIDAEHVDALANATSQLEPDLVGELFGGAEELLAMAESLPADKFGRECRERARRLERDHGIERNHQQRRDTFFSRRLNPQSGMIEGRFAFHPELGNQIFTALDREVAAMIAAGEKRGDREFVKRTFDRNRLTAEALGSLVTGGHHATRALEADITVVVDVQTLLTGELHDHSVCETGDAAMLPPETVRRLVCNGRVTPIYVDADGVVLNAGSTKRHANRAQRRALRAMYRTCAVPGCDVLFDQCEIHHIDFWHLGGLTDLDNLIPICSHHHHNVHERGWKLHLAPDRTLTVYDASGDIYGISNPDSRPLSPGGKSPPEPERKQSTRQPAA